ncbi:PREDICTED: Retrovirus-related Pol poly from [Prunus dulcis]|uniref:PREDICTED: Retrovirus-related Pol poly from n=1 Tax=Prunus dulcis TaxID=3755 RepID=A0A5E4FPX5_PRUDU|nr:PREDICTED: Retrovirus-related Pol poly from [Prunus dulcis]
MPTRWVGDLHVVGGLMKLNNKNYNTWATCMESYLQGQDFWDIVGGNDVTQPREGKSDILRKWKIKAGKAMFALKTTIEEETLEHIRKAKTPKEAWDTFATLFKKRNDTRLQLLENELLSVAQRNMTIAQYFHKVKSICREISNLDPTAAIVESGIKRIIIHGLRPEYRGFVVDVQRWHTQPSLVEFENLLADQEAMAKKMGGVSLKGEKEAFYTNKSKGSLSSTLVVDLSRGFVQRLLLVSHCKRMPICSRIKRLPNGRCKLLRPNLRFNLDAAIKAARDAEVA